MGKTTPDNTTTYGYDSVGNLTYVSDLNSEIAMIYDLAGRLTQVSTSETAHQPASLISYTYDKVGNRLSMTDATGTMTYYRNPYYNLYYNVDAITNPQGKTVEFSYDYLGRRTGRTLPNGINTTYSYDDTSRLLSLVHSGTSSFDYTYDGVGNRLSMTTAAGTHSYTYDKIYQLIQATHPTSPMEAFTYDGVDNRLSSAEFPSWTYNSANQLTGYDGTSYTYDNNGNMITKTNASGTTVYTYNAENQLTRIDFPGGGFAEYVYDGLGGRIEKNVDGTITRYLYDGEDILFEYDGTNNIITRYTHGPGIDEPLIMERGGTSYYYHADGLGSITEVTDSSGTVVASYTYDSFGKIAAQTGGLTNPYTFTGREYDSESELYYYRARYYDPKIGRFLQTDPLDMAMVILIRQYFQSIPISRLSYQYSLRNPLGISNVYQYVLNNPINLVDPMGLLTWIDIWLWPKEKIFPILIGSSFIMGGIALQWGGIAAIVASLEFTPAATVMVAPISVAMLVTGEYLIWMGVNTYINYINNIFGTNIPTLSDYYKFFPPYPCD